MTEACLFEYIISIIFKDIQSKLLGGFALRENPYRA